MNLARTLTNEETKRREEEILDRIIPTGLVDVDKVTKRREEEILDRIIPTGLVDVDEVFDKTFDKEETDDLSEYRPYDHTMDQEEDFISKDYQIYPFSLS